MGKKETKLEYFFRVVAPKITSVGAAVVVVGALFKIMHWPGAGLMLTIGLLTEAFLFLMGVIQPAPPPEAHYHWERVYPILDEGISDDEVPHLSHEQAVALAKSQMNAPKQVAGGNSGGAEALAAFGGIDAMMKQMNLSQDSFKNFGEGIKSLNDTASKMKNMSDAVTATNTYSQAVTEATKSLTVLNKAYSETANSMSGMVNMSKDAKDYHTQIQSITKNLASLNAVYEMELKDAKSHIQAMNKFYNNLTLAMENMADASKESEQFKSQMVKLTENLTTLNKVYGNMLTAMKG